MRCLHMVLGLCFCVGLSTHADTKSELKKTPAASDKRVEELIEQLGSTSFAERRRAKETLEGIGPTALPALRKAAQSAELLETKRRCEEIIRRLEDRASTQAMLAPRRVRLKLKDTLVLDAVDALATQSGYKIQVMGDRTGLAERKITLDTGETTFWEAIDQLCSKAGLKEAVMIIPRAQQPGQQPPMFPQIQLQPALPGIKAGGMPGPLPGVLPAMPPPPANAGPAFQVQAQGGGRAGQPGQVQGGRAGQPAQVQPAPMVFPNFQIQPAMGGFAGPAILNQAPPDQIQLMDGKTRETPTAYSGAVRIRVALVEVRNGEATITLDVACEPRLQDFRVVAVPRIDKAVDTLDQALLMTMQQMNIAANQMINPDGVVALFNGRQPGVSQRLIPVRLKLGEKHARSLKELSGSIPAEALTQTEALISVDNVLKAAGQTVKGKNGGSVQVHSVTRKNDGDYHLKVTLENIPDAINNPFGFGGNGVIQIQGGGVIRFQNIQINGNNIAIGGMGMPGAANHPKLLDANGKAFNFVGVTESSFTLNNGQSTQTATLVYRPQDRQGDPARLVQYGQRRVDFQVPFTLKDIPLP